MSKNKNFLRLIIWLIPVALFYSCSSVSPEPSSPTVQPSLILSPIPPTASSTPIPTQTTSLPSATFAATQTLPTITATALPTKTAKTSDPVRENTPVSIPSSPITIDNANRLTELARWGGGNANDLAYSPDGSVLAVATSLGISLYDDNSYRLETIETEMPIFSLAFSPDGETLVAGGSDGKIYFWHWRKKERTQIFDSGVKYPISYLVYSSKADILGYSQSKEAIGKPQYMFVIQISDRKRVVNGVHAEYKRFVFSKDSQWIYFASHGSVSRVSVLSGENEYLDNGGNKTAPITSVAISQFGKIIAGGNRMFLSWNFSDSRLLWDLNVPIPKFLSYGSNCKGAFESVGIPYFTTIAISPDDQFFVTGSFDNAIQIRRVMNGELLFSSTREQPSAYYRKPGVQNIVFHSSKPKFAVLYGNGLIEERDTLTGKILNQITGHPQTYTSLVVWPKSTSNQTLLAVGASNAATRIWNLSTSKVVSELGRQANTVAFSPDGTTLALGSNDWNIHLVSLGNGHHIGPISNHQDQVTGLVFLQDGKTLVSTSVDCTIKIWDITNTPPTSITLPTNILFLNPQVIKSPDGKWLVYQGEDLISLVSKTDQGKYSLTPFVSVDDPDCLAFSQDSEILAVAGNGKIIGADIQTGNTLFTSSNPGKRIAFSPDSKILASGDANGNIMLLDGQTGNEITRFPAHRGSITGLAFTNDGHILISISADGTIRLWGVGG